MVGLPAVGDVRGGERRDGAGEHRLRGLRLFVADGRVRGALRGRLRLRGPALQRARWTVAIEPDMSYLCSETWE